MKTEKSFEERELLCRRSIEYQGYEVVKFEIIDGYGEADVRNPRTGKISRFSQRPPK